MRNQLIGLIRTEAENARNGLPSGILIKLNSLEDQATIEELYKASQAGVKINLVVRGICCLRPGRPGLSENIEVKSIVGDLLEHTRIFYFHNSGDPKIYGGSADMMNRSFDRRLESLFLIADSSLKKLIFTILHFNLKDNANSYNMLEDGSYVKYQLHQGENEVNIHKLFYNLKTEDLIQEVLF